MPCNRARPTKIKPAATNTNRNTRRPPVLMRPILGVAREDSRMQEAMWAIVCAVLAGAFAFALVPTLHVPALLRTNYAGREVPTAGGVCVALAFLLTVGVAIKWNATRNGYLAPQTLVLAMGFAL